MARAAALLFVVAGHLLIAVVDRGLDGRVRGANLVSLVPGLRWVGLASPMPVFFVAAGWASAAARLTDPRGAARSAVARARTLLLLAATVTTVWGSVAVAEHTVTGARRVLTDGARLATQPLWFVAAYVPFMLAGGAIVRAARRPFLWLVACAAAVGAFDVLRFVSGAPRWTGFPGFLLAWSVPWVFGAWWSASPKVRGGREGTVGVLMFVTGASVCAVLVRCSGYSATLIDVVPGARSNSTPPTLFTVAAGVSQAGALIATARLLDAVASRHACVIGAIGRAAPAVYAWHLTGVALVSLPLAAGVPFPVRLTTGWWMLRPGWIAAVLSVTWLLVRLTGRICAGDPQHVPRQGPLSPGRTVIAGVLSFLGAAITGLWGPTTPMRAGAAAASLWSAALLLRGKPEFSRFSTAQNERILSDE